MAVRSSIPDSVSRAIDFMEMHTDCYIYEGRKGSKHAFESAKAHILLALRDYYGGNLTAPPRPEAAKFHPAEYHNARVLEAHILDCHGKLVVGRPSLEDLADLHEAYHGDEVMTVLHSHTEDIVTLPVEEVEVVEEQKAMSIQPRPRKPSSKYSRRGFGPTFKTPAPAEPPSVNLSVDWGTVDSYTIGTGPNS